MFANIILVWEYERISFAFESEGFEKLLSKGISRRYKCRQCVAFSLCSGGCNNVAYNENGIENNEGGSCIIFRSIYQYIVKETIKMIKSTNENFNYNPKVISIIKNSNHQKHGAFHYDSHYDTTKG